MRFQAQTIYYTQHAPYIFKSGNISPEIVKKNCYCSIGLPVGEIHAGNRDEKKRLKMQLSVSQ